MTEEDQTPHRDGISRRRLLGMGAAATGAVAAGSLLGSQETAATPALPAIPTYPAAPAGSTLAKTLQHGTPGTGGYRRIVPGPGASRVPGPVQRPG